MSIDYNVPATMPPCHFLDKRIRKKLQAAANTDSSVECKI